MDAIVHAPFAAIAALLVMAAAIGLFGILLRQPLIQLTGTSGFRGRLAVSSHHPKDTEGLFASGADMVLEPFQDAADCAVDLSVAHQGKNEPKYRPSRPKINRQFRKPWQ